ncbi:2-amino-4-hydroxy-6-hydroxymethyldihydropteridine diphosphokinase [Helicobacter suis]|uniref:2-amino-4-hydroxy-6- hydroxymethyldihydropteridine diphosphokinase n=1 Tax=Helicobacter suis TaxID=104628 RepID=UPI0013CF6BF4|nr:2-amino-4-hydroxy-6-hydroxymethyldihydropteridine diphosphokinase [Helicobacter suis]
MRTVVYSAFFPRKCQRTERLKNVVVLGIGSNMGNSLKIFESLWRYFAKHKAFSCLHSSPLYLNPPFGYTNQRDFYNATLSFRTKWGVNQLFGLLFYLERRWGRLRQRAFKNAPRTLDIDLIFYNHLIYKQPYLTLPHPEWAHRESVLIPLILQRLAWKEI